jgi:hypothetical protein
MRHIVSWACIASSFLVLNTFAFIPLPKSGTMTSTFRPSDWSVEQRPILRIAPNDTIDFSLFAGLTRLADGSVVVASDARNNLQFFDTNGRRIKIVGRAGRGPGEFDGIWKMSRSGDTLVVQDRSGIAHLFLATGVFLRSDPVISNPTNLYGYQRDGSRITGTLDDSKAREGTWTRASESLQRRRGAAITNLGDFPTLELTRTNSGRPKSKVYAPRNRVAVLSQYVCAGYSGGLTINCYDSQGRKFGTATLTGAKAVPVTKEDEEAYFNDIYEANVGDSRERLDQQVRMERERRTFSKSMGYFGNLVASRDDLLWVGPPSNADGRPFVTNVVPSAQTTWRVFRPDGTQVAAVSLPARFRLVEAGSDYAAGITTDDVGAEVVLVYRLKKR